MPAVPSTDRRLLAGCLRDIQLARARLASLELDELRAQLPVEAARVCGLARVTLEVADAEAVDPEPALSPEAVAAPLVHLDRTIGVLRGEARPGRPLDELDRELLWTFATATAPLLHVATLAAIARAPGIDETVVEHRRGPRRPR